MANIKISELNPLLTVEDADVLPIVDNAVTKKVTAAILRSYTQGNSVLLTGNQTIAGIKTFTAQLASSVATGTAPFSVASTTKVTNLNADLLDGLSSADFALSTRTLTAGTGLTGGGDLTANRTFAIDSTVATLTGTQTLTNKTITSPVINEILDSNGNEILGFTPIASATDYITIKNGIGVGLPVHISAAGSSANTGLHLEPKGTGLVQISDGTDATKGIRFRSSGSATSAVTLIDAVSSAGRVITLPNATGTLALTSDLTSYVPTTRTVNTTSPLAGGGNLGADLTLSIPQSSGSVNGYLASTDFATFNAKQNAITLTTTGTSGAATLVGSTLNIPNYADTDTGITSLNGLTALTQTFAVGTSGTDFGISSATSTHTFNLPTASATNRGALSSADWTTFNNKQNALTNPITGTGTTNYLPKFTGASALGNSILQETTNAIGLNVTPKAWGNNNKVFETTFSTSLIGRSDFSALGRNFFYNSADAAIYSNNGFANGYFQANGEHLWINAPSGTAGNAISFTQAMTLTNSGQLGIGTASPAYLLDVNGTARVGGKLTVASDGEVARIGASGTNMYVALSANSVDVGYIGNGIGTVVGATATDLGIQAPQNFVIATGGGTERFRIASSGAATFSSSVTAKVGSSITGSANSDWGFLVENTGTTDAHGMYINIGSSSTGIPFRVDKGGSSLFSIANSGVATFSSSVTATRISLNNTGTAARLQVKGVDAEPIAYFYNNTSTAGQVPGVYIEAGTNASDYALSVNSSAGTSYLKVKGNGTINMSSLPTSASGLSAGDIWNDGGTLKIV